MNRVDFIAEKRDGGAHTTSEIALFIRGVTEGSIPDYQVSAWLMAVYLRGMTPRETLDLTVAMAESGTRLDLRDLPGGPALDKHSTGGVGDKTTLVVVPILAAAGVPMLKMSGRGLGFTGGTVDKLEAIPGMRTELSVAEARAQTARIGAALLAQSSEMAPADRILYALRDVTATVACLPLIASSIMSKKLAAGAQRIVLDIKVGSGAFMKTRPEAEALAHTMVAIGEGTGIPTSAVLTAMEEPLGACVGNALEVLEALNVLEGIEEREASRLFVDLCLILAAHGLVAVGRVPDVAAGAASARLLLDRGMAAEKFAQIVAAQGGPASLSEIRSVLPRAPLQQGVLAEETGAVACLDAEIVGRLAGSMGAGRIHKSDPIDPGVGIELHCKTGARITRGQRLATLHLRTQDAPQAEAFARTLYSAYRIVSEEQAPRPAQTLLLC